MADAKIPLPKFLKLFTSNNVPVPKAMNVAGKIYKDYNTLAKLAQLDEVKLLSAGVENKDDRKLIMNAVRRSGYVPKIPSRKEIGSSTRDSDAGPSTVLPITAVQRVITPTKRKRKSPDEDNDLLPGFVDEAAKYGNLVFNEVLEEEILMTKTTVVNRAPLMTAWATVVAERIGFHLEEALSIASVYTEMNAVAKGVSLGVYKDAKHRGTEAIKGGSQSYVELMGRRPLYRTQTDQWRALSNGTPVPPSTAFSYISRAFRQTTSHILGALKLLVNSFTAQEINSKAWSLYTEFRPAVDEWGKRSEVKCSTILNLRKNANVPAGPAGLEKIIKKADTGQVYVLGDIGVDTEKREQGETLTLEQYEAALDSDFPYCNLDAS